MEKIAFLEANRNIVERTEALFAEEIKTGEVIVRQVSVLAIEKEAHKLVKDGVQAIIARGGTYRDLSAMNIPVPIVHLVIQSLLEQNVTKNEVAKMLGISRQALFKKMSK